MVYVTGNMHGDRERFKNNAFHRLKKNDSLIVCGDFGFLWDGGEEEQKFLHWLSRRRYNVLFVDGTHENYELLEQYPIEQFCNAPARHIEGRVYQLLRGQIYRIDGQRIFAFGGGETTDVDLHASGFWWPQEMPTAEEMDEGAMRLKLCHREVDYIVTHEPASSVKRIMQFERDDINPLNAFFEDVAQNVTFKRWFFGACHKDQAITPTQVSIFKEVIPLD